MKKTTQLYMTKVGGLPAKARSPISITAGKLKVTAVPVGSAEGWLNEVLVKQLTGTPVGFAVEVLDSVVPFAEGEHAYNATPAANLDLFQVIDRITATSGNTAKMRVAELGYSFINADGGPTESQPFLYLVIIPTNAGDDTTWEATVTTTKDVF
jgi:hypothetical protein